MQWVGWGGMQWVGWGGVGMQLGEELHIRLPACLGEGGRGGPH